MYECAFLPDVSKSLYEISLRRISQPDASRRNDLTPATTSPLSHTRLLTGALLTLIIIGLGSRQDYGFERVADVRPRPSYRRICPVSGPGFMSDPTHARNHYLDSGRGIYTRDLGSSPHPVITRVRASKLPT